jgi:hypothetical protein
MGILRADGKQRCFVILNAILTRATVVRQEADRQYQRNLRL